MKNIVLASASPRRQEILNTAGVSFKIITADVDEEKYMKFDAESAVCCAAKAKAKAVIDKVIYPSIIIGADTIVYCDEILVKPKDEEDAALMLRKLSGNMHYVYTGVCLIDSVNGRSLTKAVKTKVTMAKLTDDEISSYIKTGEPMDKAGGYAAQGIASKYIRYIEGDFFNVVGLPISELRDMFKEFEIYI